MQPKTLPARVSSLALGALLLSCAGGGSTVADGGKDADSAAGAETGAGEVKGTVGRPSLDPRAIGALDLSKVTVAAFSQSNVGGRDEQVLTLAPDLVPRAWAQWDRDGLQASDYAFDYPAACRANGTVFVGGLTASIIFADQTDAATFADRVGRNGAGEPVAHDEIVKGAFRGSLASPGLRQMIVDIAKLQIDGGADGVFFDEANAGYDGANYDGNEGFDDHHVADFGRYLCAKHGDDPAALTKLAITAQDRLDCSGTDPGATFDYRGYLARRGVASVPLAATNPLALEWGRTVPNRPDPTAGSFVETYASLVYWQDIVVAVRSYARERYGKEVLITANGIFPFVDLQSVGLYDWNKDATGTRGFDYVPTKGTAADTHLDGTVSFLPVLQSLKQRSKRILEATGGHEVPLLLFLDWPTDSMNRYYAMPTTERQDYIRLRLAEAYALGMWFALPLATTTDSKTATALGMMDFFAILRDFYRAHADVLRGGHEGTAVPTVSAAGVVAQLVAFDDGRAVLHLINHNYGAGFVAQTAVSATLPLGQAPTSVMLASPDLPADQPATFTYADGKLTVDVGTLVSSLMVIVR